MFIALSITLLIDLLVLPPELVATQGFDVLEDHALNLLHYAGGGLLQQNLDDVVPVLRQA